MLRKNEFFLLIDYFSIFNLKLFRIIVSGEKWAGVAYDLFERAKSNDETIAELRLKSFGAGVAKETLFFAEMNNPKQLQ